MTRTVTTTHYKATDVFGNDVSGEVITLKNVRQLKKYIEKVHGIVVNELSSYFTTDKYELSDEDFIKYATKVEK